MHPLHQLNKVRLGDLGECQPGQVGEAELQDVRGEQMARRRVAWWTKRSPSESGTVIDTDSSRLSAKGVGQGAQHARQAAGFQIGVAEFHQPGGEHGVAAFDAQIPGASEGAHHPVDRGAGQPGGPYEIAHGLPSVGRGQFAQYREASDQGPTHSFGVAAVAA